MAQWIGDDQTFVADWALRGMIQEGIRQFRSSVKDKAGEISEIPSDIWMGLLDNFVSILDEELRKALTREELHTISRVITSLALQLEGANDNDKP